MTPAVLPTPRGPTPGVDAPDAHSSYPPRAELHAASERVAPGPPPQFHRTRGPRGSPLPPRGLARGRQDARRLQHPGPHRRRPRAARTRQRRLLLRGQGAHAGRAVLHPGPRLRHPAVRALTAYRLPRLRPSTNRPVRPQKDKRPRERTHPPSPSHRAERAAGRRTANPVRRPGSGSGPGRRPGRPRGDLAAVPRPPPGAEAPPRCPRGRQVGTPGGRLAPPGCHRTGPRRRTPPRPPGQGAPPAALLRNRLTRKRPPEQPPAPAPAAPPKPRWSECAACGSPVNTPGICAPCAGIAPHPVPDADSYATTTARGMARIRAALLGPPFLPEDGSPALRFSQSAISLAT